MAKDGYRIRTSLNVGQLDRQINLKSDEDGAARSVIPVGMITLRTVATLMILTMAVLVLVFLNVFKENHWFLTGVIIFTMYALTIYLLMPTQTGEPRYRQFQATRWYMNPPMRRLYTLRDRDVSEFEEMIGVVVDEDGRFLYKNGDIGVGYWVAGSASILMFEETARTIIDHVDDFWRTVEPGLTFTQISIREAQKTDLQVGNHHLRYEMLKNQPGMDDVTLNLLADLLDSDIHMQQEVIQKHYRNTQQYIVVRAKTEELLVLFGRALQHHLDQRGTVIRKVRRLRKKDVERLNRTLFTYVS